MRILVLNSGSSSVKFQLIETSPEQIASSSDRMVARGSIERIGSSEALVKYTSCCNGSENFAKPIADHKQAIETAFQSLTGEHGVIGSADEVEAVGHRMVHGGEHFTVPAVIDEEVVRRIELCFDLAPLHNPHNLKGYFAAKQHLPNASHVAVFDTSFHHTLPPKAFLYGIPYSHYKKDKVRRYGFHGVSHRYVSYRFAQLHGTTRDHYKLITCHLGNGCSMCAIDHGRSVDTSMGFTPLEGLVMGTRSGSLDPGVLFYLVGKSDMSIADVEVMLNRHSGLYGLSGVSNDMRDLLEEADRGNVRAQLAVDVFCYRVKKYFGAYLAALNGADAIIFTGGIGENAAMIRSRVCDQLDGLGVSIDWHKNEGIIDGREGEISTDESRIKVWVIPTNEELVIARDTLRCIFGIPYP
ncbi:MAG TPA: acetate kinase [Bryobacteraceae bacterium]|nr:acetate kinase [Bryobacteraceae bacterium]